MKSIVISCTNSSDRLKKRVCLFYQLIDTIDINQIRFTAFVDLSIERPMKNDLEKHFNKKINDNKTA